MPTNHKSRLVAASVAGLFFVAGALALLFYTKGKTQAPSSEAAAVTVDVAEVHQQNITEWMQYSGHLEAVERVDVRPQVSGMLTAVHFKDGHFVRKGEPLFTIDPRPFEAEVARAQAQLAGAEARAAYTTNDLARNQRLLATNTIARRDFDEKQNAAREARANVQAAQAALKTAQLNLEYTRITAPITGRVSRAEVTVGNLVAPTNVAALTSLVSADRIYAAFDVDESSYLQVINAAQDKDMPIHLGLVDSQDYPLSGKLSSIDNHLDSTSGTIKLRAELENRDGKLVPGLYVRVKLGSPNQRKAILVTENAIGIDQAKRFVLVVDPRGKTSYREISLGGVQDGLRVVESGLTEGERIVVNGLQRVRPGDTVTPHPVQMGATPSNATKI
ncbi:efflux RND transporter periplasmic adaptor subunit [Aeromonas hydrophila]